MKRQTGRTALGFLLTTGLLLTLAGPAHAQYYGQAGACGVGDYNTPVANQGFVPRLSSWFNPRFSPLPDRFAAPYTVRGQRLNLKLAQLKSKIRFGLANGSLTQSEANSLTRRFERIASREQSLRNSGNQLTSNERQDILNRLASLDSEMNRQMRDNERSVVAFNQFPYLGY